MYVMVLVFYLLNVLVSNANVQSNLRTNHHRERARWVSIILQPYINNSAPQYSFNAWFVLPSPHPDLFHSTVRNKTGIALHTWAAVDAKTRRHTSTSRAPRRGLLAAPPRDPVRPVLYASHTDFARKPDEYPTNVRSGGTPSGKAHLGLP